MIRTLDATAINVIAGHAEVRPWLGFADPKADIDLSGVVGNIDNFALLTPNGDGAYILTKLQPGLYAAHTLAMPSARGRPMLRLMREGFRAMFRASDAVEIVTQIPDGNDAGMGWSDVAGFRDTFRREAFFPLMGEMVGCQFRSLTYGDWVVRDPVNRKLGQDFHDTVFAAHGHHTHEDDPVHDHWVGATIGGCLDGNPTKAIGLYNRWASVAGYAQAAILSHNPLLVHTGDAVVQTANGWIEVLRTTRREAPSETLEGLASCP